VLTSTELGASQAAARERRGDLLDLGWRAPPLCGYSRLIVHS
jgi:hypothetical protein